MKPASKHTEQDDDEFPRKAIMVKAGKTIEEKGRNLAAILTGPEVAAYRVIQGAERSSGLGEQLDVPTLLAYLREQAVAVQGGNLAQAEAMLINQATALQSLFARLAERGMGCDAIPGFEANMRMALRAQSQCRATLETLAMIKNPTPIAFVRQANIGQAVQVNNAAPPTGEGSRARETENQQNGLLEAQYGERLDAKTAGTTGCADQAMATLGEINRTENDTRKSKGEPQQLQGRDAASVARVAPGAAGSR